MCFTKLWLWQTSIKTWNLCLVEREVKMRRRHVRVRLTESNQSQCLSSDPRRSWRHLADLLHALNPRALPQGLREQHLLVNTQSLRWQQRLHQLLIYFIFFENRHECHESKQLVTEIMWLYLLHLTSTSFKDCNILKETKCFNFFSLWAPKLQKPRLCIHLWPTAVPFIKHQESTNLMQPSGASVQGEDVTECGVGCFLHRGRWHITHSYA